MATVTMTRAVRFGTWPNDHAVALISQCDHTAALDPDDLRGAIARARRDGRRALRTSALLEPSAAVAESVGFSRIDTLALLERNIGTDTDTGSPARRPPTGEMNVRSRPLRRWHHRRAARVDRAAFGPLWAMDRAALAAIRRATPRHWARQMTDGAGEMTGFVIIGAGHRDAHRSGLMGYLQRLSVHPDHQGRGLGRALVDDALGVLARCGATRVMVNTGVDNHRALALYRSAGFALTGAEMSVWEYRLE